MNNATENWLDELKITDLPDKHRELAEIILEVVDRETALRVVMCITEHFGKQGVYLKGLDSLIRIKKEEFIRKNFNGRNHCELARATGYSERWIYNILKNDNKDRQPDLFKEIEPSIL